jgi:hypothetical protein
MDEPAYHAVGLAYCNACIVPGANNAHLALTKKMLDKSGHLRINFDTPRMKATNGIFELDANPLC